jgi:hypothetical protein
VDSYNNLIMNNLHNVLVFWDGSARGQILQLSSESGIGSSRKWLPAAMLQKGDQRQ